MEKKNYKILFFGSGVIGGSVGGWVSSCYDNVYLMDRGDIAKALRAKGVTLYEVGKKEEAVNVKVKIVESLDEAQDADVVVIAVKNYSMEPVAKLIREKLGDKPIILSMANGLDNQRILPKYFSKVVYCVICYNAWMDELGIIGYHKKGPLVIGTPNNELRQEALEIARIFNPGVETIVTDHLQDAAHSKIVLNLSNSVTTLLGPDFKEVKERKLLQTILSNVLYEGTRIVKAAGYNECKLGEMPSWSILWLGTKMPYFISKWLFERNLSKMVMSSMAQDVIQRHGTENELESINGYVVRLADEHGVKAPYNRAIYDLCKREFAKKDFKPLDIKTIWSEINKRLNP